jgi:hypothetical protein
MLQKYNIVFTPDQNLKQFIQYAEKLSQDIPPDKYLLGVNSIPHVSLCQFELESDRIEDVWGKVIALKPPALRMTFAERRSKSYPGHPKWGGVCWVSLMPDHIDQLTKIHLEIANIIKKPLNAAFSEYDPHLTLFNSLAEESCAFLNRMPKVDPPLAEDFNVALGLIDDLGQVTEILVKSKP